MSNIFSAVCTCTRDAEQRFLPSGGAVLNVNLANNQGFGDKQKTMFIRVAVFGKRAEGQLKDFLVKGQQVFVSGELSLNEYQSVDGTTKTGIELNATVIDLVGGKRNDSEAPAQQRQKPQQSAPASYDDLSDDLPFVSLNWQIKNHLI